MSALAFRRSATVAQVAYLHSPDIGVDRNTPEPPLAKTAEKIAGNVPR